MTYRTSARQTWTPGQIVSVGFIKGLVVKEKIATPGDYRPDLYVLWQPATNRFYQFTPHCGISRCATIEEARAW